MDDGNLENFGQGPSNSFLIYWCIYSIYNVIKEAIERSTREYHTVGANLLPGRHCPSHLLHLAAICQEVVEKLSNLTLTY